MARRSRRWWFLLLLLPAGIGVGFLAWRMPSVPPRHGPLTPAHVRALDRMAAARLEPFGSHEALTDYLAPLLQPPPEDDPDETPEWLREEGPQPPTAANERAPAVATPRYEPPPEMDGVRVDGHVILLRHGRLHSVALEDPPRLVDTLGLGPLTPAQRRSLRVVGRTVVVSTGGTGTDASLQPVDVAEDGSLGARPALYLNHGFGAFVVGGERYLVGTSSLQREELRELPEASLPATRSAPTDVWSPLLSYDDVMRPVLALDAPDLLFVIICDVAEPLRCHAHGLIAQGIPHYPPIHAGRAAAWLQVRESDRVGTARDPDAPVRGLLLRFPLEGGAPGGVRTSGLLLAVREHTGGAWLALSGQTVEYWRAPPPLQVVDIARSQFAQSELGVASPDPTRVVTGQVDWPVNATLTATHAFFLEGSQVGSYQREADGISIALASSEAPTPFHVDQGVSSLDPLGEADIVVMHANDQGAFRGAARVVAGQTGAPRVVQHGDSSLGWPSSPCAAGRVVHGPEAAPVVAYAYEDDLTVVRLGPAEAQVLGHVQVPQVWGSRPPCILAMVDERLHLALGDTVRSFRLGEGELVETGRLSVSDSATEQPSPSDGDPPEN